MDESCTRAPDAQQGPGVLLAHTRRRSVDRVALRKETNGLPRSGERMSVVHSAAVGTSDRHAVFFQFIAQSFDRQDRIVEHRQLLFDATHMHIHRPGCSVLICSPTHCSAASPL